MGQVLSEDWAEKTRWPAKQELSRKIRKNKTKRQRQRQGQRHWQRQRHESHDRNVIYIGRLCYLFIRCVYWLYFVFLSLLFFQFSTCNLQIEPSVFHHWSLCSKSLMMASRKMMQWSTETRCYHFLMYTRKCDNTFICYSTLLYGWSYFQ